MASALLPSLRYIRATLVAGLLWLVAIDVLFQPGLSRHRHPDANQVWDAVREIANVAAPTSTVVALLFAAYLLGVVSEATLGGAMRLLTKWIVRGHRWLARWILRDRRRAWRTRGRMHPPEHWRAQVATSILDNYLSSATGRSSRFFLERDDRHTGEDRRIAVGVRRTLVRAQAAGDPSAASAIAEVDRWRAESEFRLQLLPPILGLAAAVAKQIDWRIALIAGAFCFTAMAASANHCAELANDLLADWAEDDERALRDGFPTPTSRRS